MTAPITATAAAEALLADIRQLLARHDGAETVDELRELTDELGATLRRARGQIRRLARKQSEEPVPPTPPTEPSVTPAAEAVTKQAAATAPPAGPPPGEPRRPVHGPPRWLRAILGFLLLLAICVGLVLLAGQPGEPCMEFDGWRWEPTVPRTLGCEAPVMGE